MSNWLSEYSGEDQLQVDQLNAKGIAHKATQQKKEPGLFDGAGSAIPRGALAGAVKVVDTVAKPFERVADHIGYSVNDTLNGGLDGALDVREPSFSEIHADKNKERQNKLVMEIEQLEDKENTGLIGNIGFGVSDFATRAVLGSLAGGPVGAVATTGLSETNYSYEDLTHKGVDSGTAAKVAVIDGVVAGASAALPINYGFKGAGGLVKDAALSIGGATALSTGGQALSGEILKSEDYNKQAKKYEITAESVGTELVLNGLLFGAGRYAQGLNKDIDAELHNIDVDALETRNTQIQSALVLNEMQLEDAAAPVKPSDPIQHNNHLKNMSGAVESLKAGRPVNVVHPVKGEEKQKPVNYDSMALPTNAKTIARRAQQEGVDPSVALTISHLETGGSFSHTAKNKKSTAHGLFQVLDKTWKGQGGGDRNNVDEQIKQGLKHIKNANASMRKSLGRDPVAHEQYLGHLLGPGGAAAVLKADPNAKLIDIVRKYDSKNADAIVNNNGMSGLSVGQAIGKWQTKWNRLSSRYGGNGTSTAIGMDGSSYDMAYEVKSLDELIASNDAAYGVNPNYPSELQPRDRTREASRQQIEDMANDLRPELLGESNMLSNGAPIIGMDGVVESGNGRTLAIGKAYENGRAEEYRAYIEQYAADRGWDISGINKPVLVRTRLTDTDRVQFTKLANESDVSQFSASERAASDVDRLPDASLLQINGDGTINLDQSMDYVRNFIASLPKAEQGSVITGDGRLSQEGKRRIESAVAQHAYGDSSLVTRLAENLDDDSKTVLNALLRAAPQLSQLDALVKQGGRHQNSIAKDLAQAAQKLSDLKASGMRVDDYLNQGQLIDDGLAPGARDFLNVFDQNNRSAKAIGENIQSRIDEIESMGDPRQGSLFGDGPEESAALDIIMQNPDQHISVTRYDPDGNVEEITMTLRERLDELEAEAKQAEQDTLATQAAISCALQFGE
ncbi:lytic transglycosylase domain-containing protein [Acinetobacter sp. ANC 3781]|uniref:lytic transglycosylase domain-containing protein n=1 Tax=Acinetobacter sp. ANC 3781 TaxID=2529835 RepID=UPI0010406D5C|nr:lytic transglycosylase domain-containing protein [Acinetobacter sp. ANC 3781]TCB80143.1 lytic transglycosylase domain-containing protein [Acinetobacter sp. ANC 3781]